MQNKREGNVSIDKTNSCLVLIKRIFMVIIVSICLLTISGEVVWADKQGVMVIESQEFYEEDIIMNSSSSYGGKQSHPWKPFKPKKK